MKLNVYLSNRLKEVLTEGEWVLGTNFKAEITALQWKDAIKKVDGFNTIADLTFHIDYYLAGVLKVFKGGSLDIRDKFSFDAPPIESEEDWNERINKFCTDAEQFIECVLKMPEEDILGDFVEKQYGTNLRNIDVLIEHTYYHLGQIILIKKRIANN